MSFLLDLIYPKFCVGCNTFGRYLCKKCFNELHFIKQDRCIFCFQPSIYGEIHKNCKKNNSLDGVLSICGYDKLARKIVSLVKYRLQSAIYKDVLSCVPKETIKKFIEFKKRQLNPCLQTVPLHKKRQNIRGFNQSDELTKFFAEAISLPVIDIVERIKNTKPQARIKNKSERILNIKGSFYVKKRNIELNTTIILVDDVCTSASTANEIAKELKKTGVKKVYLFSFARGYRAHD